MMQKIINNPESGVPEIFEEFYNSSGGTLTHGMVVVEDLATTAKSPYRYCTTTTSAVNQAVAGVVFDPSGNGVPNGARGLIMRRGYHPAVTVDSSDSSISIGAVLVTHTVAGEVGDTTAAVTAGALVGYAAEALTAADTVIAVRVDVK